MGEVNIVSERHKDPQTVKVESSRKMYDKPDAELIVSEQMQGYSDILHLLKGKIPGVEVIGDKGVGGGEHGGVVEMSI